MRRLTLVPGLAAATLLTLTGCFGGTGTGGSGSEGTGGDGSTGDGSTGGSTAVGDCLQGSWDLDEQALAEDLGENLSQGGAINVVSSEASGDVILNVDGENMTYVSDVTYTITVDMGEGLTMVVEQHQAGDSSGKWSLDGEKVVFEDWVSGITVTNDISINGESSSAASPLPETGDGVPMQVTCAGDVLTTQPDASPFASTWARSRA
jgi:hypothetical protein